MAIGVVQIGLKRFYDSAKSNHQKLLNTLNSRYAINVYDYYRDADSPNCPFDLSGKVQVWDFLTARDKINEDIIIKLRSDVYFTQSSIEVICNEIDNVQRNECDVVYLGIDFMNDYNKVHKREDARSVAKTTDFVVIARRSCLLDTDTVTESLKAVKDKSGNKTFYAILTPEARAVKVSCQMYLFRKEYEQLESWQIYWDWCSEYKKSQEAQTWVYNNRDTINAF
ncbi:MAG: hypothetical protein RLZZ196_124 [Bacteroidota bacterium]|jgi:hypothetical protein